MIDDLYNLEAEQMVIGSLLRSPQKMDELLPIVSIADLVDDRHQIIYENARNLYSSNRFDFASLKQWLREKKLLDRSGGIEYVNQLALSVPSVSLANHYAELVRDLATKRRGYQMAINIQNMTLQNQYENIEDYITAVNMEFDAIATSNKKSNMVRLSDFVENHVQHKVSGVIEVSPKTGFWGIDKWMRGTGKTRLIVVAGRPGTGKTAYMLKTGRSMATQENGPVAMFSLEMSKEELLDRILSDITAIPFGELTDNSINDTQKDLLLKSNGVLVDHNLYIDDSARMDVPYIAAQLRRMKREHGNLGGIFIDYLGLIDTNKRKGENDTSAIGRVTGELKKLARELKCSIHLLCQMNREIEKRSTKRPVLSDLRDSGSIEQDADMVIFLYKDEEKSSANCSHIEMIVAKGRQTGMRDFVLNFYGSIQRMEEKVII